MSNAKPIGGSLDGLTFDPEDALSMKWNDNTEEGINMRKKIFSRQLSGDPSKLNPALPLNQQVKMLPYNPRHEIDRSNFEVGKLVG